MTVYLPDTTFLVDFEHGQPHALSFAQDCLRRSDTMVTCLIIVAEYYSGRVPAQRPELDELIQACDYWEMNREVGLVAARHRLESRRQGIQIHLPDALVAALAFVRGATVVTENPKDFQMTGLDVLSLRPSV